ncbi:MAG: FeoB-associated Cys-rich membrane protein [Gracilibacteraceae bacterium]|nr:FeoB-associated Cys-rich membrane protein [Gracilibacteraceae bacterium]
MATIITGLCVAGAMALAIRHIWKERRRDVCACGCANCARQKNHSASKPGV